MELTTRQLEIVALVKKNEPITGEQIAELLGISRPTIRSDLSILVMLGMLDAKPKVGYFIGNTSGHPQKQKTIHYKVKDVQGVPVVIKQTATVHDAVVSLFLEDVGSLMVISDEGHLTGIVSRKDLLKVTMGNPHAATMPISLVMTREPNIISVAPEDSVVYAAEKLMKHEIDSLPVVINNEQNKLEVVGRVTKTTMTRMLLELIKQD